LQCRFNGVSLVNILILAEGGETFTQRFPWVMDFVALALGLGLIGVMVFWARGAKGIADGFLIRVDEEKITFSGQFPRGMEGMVEEFLLNDVAVTGAYQVRGVWEGEGLNRRLVVVVRGENARPMEQRIRNYLKLNIKPPRNA
jgi:hypothetical protein